MVYVLTNIKRLTTIFYSTLIVALTVISPINITLVLPTTDPAGTPLPVVTSVTGEVMVRAKINQYFQLGSNVIIGAGLQNAESWTPYVFESSEPDRYSDGWYYWSKPLIPDKATNLLLEGVTFNWQKTDDKYCLALDIKMEAQLADRMEYDGLSNNATILAATATGDKEKLNELTLTDNY